MKVVITALGSDLQAKVDPRFGRAKYFIIIDTETMEYETIFNEGINKVFGAGMQSSQLINFKKVSVIITGNIGPNAHQALATEKIKIYQGIDTTVEKAIVKLKNNQLMEIIEPGPAHGGGAA